MGGTNLRGSSRDYYAIRQTISRSKPVNLHTAWSLGRQFYGENGIRAAMYLQALTGNTISVGGTASAFGGRIWRTRIFNTKALRRLAEKTRVLPGAGSIGFNEMAGSDRVARKDGEG